MVVLLVSLYRLGGDVLSVLKAWEHRKFEYIVIYWLAS
jgi:hypothetical protein